MFCPKCGVAVQDDAAFCAKCGATVAVANPNASTAEAKSASVGPRTNSTVKRWGFLVVVVAVCAVVLWVAFVRDSSSSGVSGLAEQRDPRDEAREVANRVKCSNNLREIGMGNEMYSNEHQGQFAPDVATIASAQGLAADALICPSAGRSLKKSSGGVTCTYIYVGRGLTHKASNNVVVAYEPLEAHGEGMNVLWADASVTFERGVSAQQIIAALQAGKNPPR